VRDYRHVISYARTLADVDPQRIGIWGTSYSGGHVLVLGAVDRRVKAVVSQVPATIGFKKKILARLEGGIRVRRTGPVRRRGFRPITQSKIFFLKPIGSSTGSSEMFGKTTGLSLWPLSMEIVKPDSRGSRPE
jgi:hypothetical protein